MAHISRLSRFLEKYVSFGENPYQVKLVMMVISAAYFARATTVVFQLLADHALEALPFSLQPT